MCLRKAQTGTTNTHTHLQADKQRAILGRQIEEASEGAAAAAAAVSVAV